mmetsp:Transcript_31794/g.43393  ORF Transcript_31794/g.43393 Transcript_31794/m.43393 type:complete len:101 (-) Transcript_31794:389-691(-)
MNFSICLQKNSTATRSDNLLWRFPTRMESSIAHADSQLLSLEFPGSICNYAASLFQEMRWDTSWNKERLVGCSNIITRMKIKNYESTLDVAVYSLSSALS